MVVLGTPTRDVLLRRYWIVKKDESILWLVVVSGASKHLQSVQERERMRTAEQKGTFIIHTATPTVC